jgi:hypothetical protein
VSQVPIRDRSLDESSAAVNAAVRAIKPARCVPAILEESARPDPGLFWIPEAVTSLCGTPGYDRLSADQRLAYNHYCAALMVEQFIWIETFFLVAPVATLLRRGGVPDAYLPVLRSFLADEENHNAVFWKLLGRARPDLYGEPGYRLFRVPAALAFTVRLAERFPRLLSSWVLFGNFFEERSIALYRAYEKAGDRMDPLFCRVHALHAQDEARHCNVDRLVAEWLLAGQGKAASRVNGWFLGQTMRMYHDPRWGFDAPVRALVRDYPDLGGDLQMLLRDAVTARGADYLGNLFDRAVVPITDRNRRRFPILDSAIRSLH